MKLVVSCLCNDNRCSSGVAVTKWLTEDMNERSLSAYSFRLYHYHMVVTVLVALKIAVVIASLHIQKNNCSEYYSRFTKCYRKHGSGKWFALI